MSPIVYEAVWLCIRLEMNLLKTNIMYVNKKEKIMERNTSWPES